MAGKELLSSSKVDVLASLPAELTYFDTKEDAEAAAAGFQEYLNNPAPKVARPSADDTPLKPCPKITPDTQKRCVDPMHTLL
jgi:hypothetical protein